MITIRNTAILTLMFGGALSFGSSDIMAQTFGIEYTSEWQTDCKGSYDWLNLLKTNAAVQIGSNVSVEISTISTSKTNENTLIDDLLTYSNIEAGNIPLTLARLGLGLNIENVELFVGINNVNEDYFTSNMTSFFTNSSCGISPTLSCNYDIANYPLASWCLHYRQQSGNFTWQTSLYPGQGYYRILGHDNLFNLDINRNGIFSISSIDFKRNGINTIMGVALHYGHCIGDANGEQIEVQIPSAEKKFTAAPWILSEFSLPHNIGLIAHGSFSTVKIGCKDYLGLGVIYSGKYIQTGLSFNYASFTDTKESDLELTARIPIFSDRTYLQPAIHLVTTDEGHCHCLGMLRGCYIF